ncbi:MAG: glycosidase [Lachnospiraceae bacterium]|nr:glycosidase [Lachnospiraceae bacterium]
MAWYDNSVFYHIYPLGLCGCPHENHGEEGHHFGKLKAWADHARKLGCTAIYIGPLFESEGHGYETTDYRKVDRRLGTNGEFKDYVSYCHSIGLHVIVDGVFNHTGRSFFAFQDLKEHRENSRYKDWYCNVNFYGNNEYNDGFSYDNWGGYNLLVKLNQWNPEVQNYLFDSVRFWVSEFDVDGIRLDAADVLDHNFMRQLRKLTDSLKPEFWLMGEVIHGDYSRWANGEMLHSVTNYELHKGLYSGHNDHNYFEIAHSVRRLLGICGNTRLYTFVDNHDVERLATKLINKAHLCPVMILNYTLPGIPSLYYGTEFGIEGKKEWGSDWSLRPCLELSDYQNAYEDNELTHLITQLGRCKQQYPELTYGEYRELYLQNRQYAFARVLDGRAVIVALNNDDRYAVISIPLPIAATRATDILIDAGENKQDPLAEQAEKEHREAEKAKKLQFMAADIRTALQRLQSAADTLNGSGEDTCTIEQLHSDADGLISLIDGYAREFRMPLAMQAPPKEIEGPQLHIQDGRLEVQLPANQGTLIYVE